MKHRGRPSLRIDERCIGPTSSSAVNVVFNSCDRVGLTSWTSNAQRGFFVRID